MRFKVEIEVEISDEDILELINNDQEWNDKETYSELSEIPKDEIIEFLNTDDFMRVEIDDYGYEIEKINIIEE